jgi:hypothetical protein
MCVISIWHVRALRESKWIQFFLNWPVREALVKAWKTSPAAGWHGNNCDVQALIVLSNSSACCSQVLLWQIDLYRILKQIYCVWRYSCAVQAALGLAPKATLPRLLIPTSMPQHCIQPTSFLPILQQGRPVLFRQTLTLHARSTEIKQLWNSSKLTKKTSDHL